jgi:tRNA modification GTPase
MLSFDVDDTVAAIASPGGGGLRGIIRISGQNCLKIIAAAFGSDDLPSELIRLVSSNATAKKLAHAPIHQAASIRLDASNPDLRLAGDLLIWPSKQSYTRQPSAEFHTIGSPPLLTKALHRLCGYGARIANPGEFTLRAFLSGRLDLPQAEAILSIIDAQAEAQLGIALRQLAGGLSGPLENARHQLINLLAEIEAGLDFVEEDIQFISRSDILDRLTETEIILNDIASQINSRDLSSEVLKVALIGLPNSGKSTLFNELLGEHRAIVSHQVGTTTDFLIGQLELDGIRVELIDTAGFESISNAISKPAAAAQTLREQIEAQAHIKLFCVDSSRPLLPWEFDRLEEFAANDALDEIILVMTKSDLGSSRQIEAALSPQLLSKLRQSHQILPTSVPSLDCLEALKQTLRQQLLRIVETQTEIVASTSVRTRESLEAAKSFVKQAMSAADAGAGDELVAADLRNALNELGLMAGTVYTDDILDMVFSRFCIGK